METADNLIEMVEALADRRFLNRFLLLCVSLNVVCWLVTILFADWVFEAMSRILPDKIGALLLGVPFGLGMYITYMLIRIKTPDIEDNRQLDSEMMASFSYQAHSTKRWFVWMFAVIGGVLNVLLLIAVNMYFADQI